MSIKNQDYAYFQVVYYDVPSLTAFQHAFGGKQSTPLALQMDYNACRTDTGQIYDSSSLLEYIQLDLRGIMNAEQIAECIKAQLMSRQVQLALNPSLTTGSPEALNILSYISDFIFDPLTQKFAFILKPPTTAPGALMHPGYLVQLTLTFYSMEVLTPRQNKIMAGIFGGNPQSSTQFGKYIWQSVFQGPPSIRTSTILIPEYPLGSLSLRKLNKGNVYFDAAFPQCDSVIAYPAHPSKMSINNYMYIRGCPEASIWNTDGTSTDFAAILPLNRPYGQQAAAGEANYLTTKTHVVKTTLNSLRVMKLTLTDEDGDPMYFEDDYILKFAVLFDID